MMYTVAVTSRDPKVKAKALRRTGFVPGCIYGSQLAETISIQMEQSAAEKLVREKGIGYRVDIELNGEHISALVKDAPRDILKNSVEHVEFQALDSKRKVNSTAKILLLNREKLDGRLEQTLFEIPYTALPADLVETVSVDLAGLKPGCRIALTDLNLSENIDCLIDMDTLVLSVFDTDRVSSDAQDGEENAE